MEGGQCLECWLSTDRSFYKCLCSIRKIWEGLDGSILAWIEYWVGCSACANEKPPILIRILGQYRKPLDTASFVRPNIEDSSNQIRNLSNYKPTKTKENRITKRQEIWKSVLRIEGRGTYYSPSLFPPNFWCGNSLAKHKQWHRRAVRHFPINHLGAMEREREDEKLPRKINTAVCPAWVCASHFPVILSPFP